MAALATRAHKGPFRLDAKESIIRDLARLLMPIFVRRVSDVLNFEGDACLSAVLRNV